MHQPTLVTSMMQAFLNALLSERYGWTDLPPGCNLLTADYASDRSWFEQHIAQATAIHFTAPPNLKVMRYRVTLSKDGTRIVDTTDGKRGGNWGALDLMWVDAWSEARRLLDLPMDAPRSVPSEDMVRSPPPPPPRAHPCLPPVSGVPQRCCRLLDVSWMNVWHFEARSRHMCVIAT
jgi:hypothetical protein